MKASTPNEPLTEAESTASEKFLKSCKGSGRTWTVDADARGNRTPHSPIQTRNHKKRAVGLSQQISRDAEPFHMQWLPANGLPRPAIPVHRVVLIAFLTVRPRPIALRIPP